MKQDPKVQGAPASGPTKKAGRPKVPPEIRCEIWARSAGRCSFCNSSVLNHFLTQEEGNFAELAHIVGCSPDGPRGERDLSEELATAKENLTLLCDTCHRLIDKRQYTDKYTNEYLVEMKRAHEARVELVTGIAPNLRSSVVLYGAKIDEQDIHASFKDATEAMFPGRFPANRYPIELGLVNAAVKDSEPRFWDAQSAQLLSKFQSDIKPLQTKDEGSHFSVFAFAPQPLLMLLGSLLTDKTRCNLYQPHRKTGNWRWPDEHESLTITESRPTDCSGVPALVLSFSAKISHERVTSVLGQRASIWELSIPSPDRNCLTSQSQLTDINRAVGSVLDHIQHAHGMTTPIHVFPAMPCAAAVEFGRAIMPKSSAPLHLYDQNNSAKCFVKAITLHQP